MVTDKQSIRQLFGKTKSIHRSHVLCWEDLLSFPLLSSRLARQGAGEAGRPSLQERVLKSSLSQTVLGAQSSA